MAVRIVDGTDRTSPSGELVSIARAGSRSEGATGAVTACRYSQDHKHPHAGHSYGTSRSKQQSDAFGGSSSSGLRKTRKEVLNTASTPSDFPTWQRIRKRLVGAVALRQPATAIFRRVPTIAPVVDLAIGIPLALRYMRCNRLESRALDR